MEQGNLKASSLFVINEWKLCHFPGAIYVQFQVNVHKIY